MNEKLTLSELGHLFYARQYAYDILRRFFVEEPSKEYLKQFVQKNMIDFFPFKEDSAGIQEGIEDIKAYLATHDVVHIGHHFDELHWDYTRMFIGPFTLKAPPWESSYVRKDKLLFQGTTMNVRRFYDKYGMAVSDFNIEADDHIGLELDFIFNLNELCIQEIEGIEQNDFKLLKQLLQDQQAFLNDHLLKFTPEFCKSVKKDANTQFFSGLAKLLHYYLFIDSMVLKKLLNIEFIKRGQVECLI
ncbi:molecular chaperone TorD family protein [Bacillus sp. FJAT-49705]|uniref:Molecular chaperone TorD family protein n=1 Tax=Cytobacillus citreus TaxID=2833586 RepID=A0ABS5NUN4_9BACI|nr:molecular chaperone TorD family protein [Cytobacillus citreus]MBS4191540.1 molecular chaperone TorD family protein [Cytobacillus citreus]